MTDPTAARDRAIEGLARRLELQALMAARPGQLDELEQIAREVRALAGASTADVAAPPHPDPCSTCGGYGIVHDPGHYAPGEQFVEPPSDERCEDCVGTGMREVQERIRAAAPEGVACTVCTGSAHPTAVDLGDDHLGHCFHCGETEQACADRDGWDCCNHCDHEETR